MFFALHYSSAVALLTLKTPVTLLQTLCKKEASKSCVPSLKEFIRLGFAGRHACVLYRASAEVRKTGLDASKMAT